MKFQKPCGFGLIFVGMASLIFFGCVRVIINTSTKEAPKLPPFETQSLLEEKISLSRFESADTKIELKDVREILDYASLVAQCGDDNPDPRCGQKFTDMSNDSGCNIKFELEKSPTSPAEIPNWPPIFSFPNLSGAIVAGDPLNCRADGVICSPSDLEAVWGVNPPNEGIKLVREINLCENTPGNWRACAQFPSSGQAIAIRKNVTLDEDDTHAIDTQLQGILWLHEFGHTRGLHHTDKPYAINRDHNAVMAPYVWYEQTKLNRQECFKLRRGRP